MKINTIIVGSLNTDLIISGANKLLGAGELTSSEGFSVAAGGKSRNIASMIATLKKDGSSISFIGKTLKDKFGFWEYPIKSLKDLHIDFSYTKIIESDSKYEYPGLAIIPIDKEGQNQIYLVPGINESFSKQDVAAGEELFNRVGKNNGVMGITFEMPVEAAIESMQLAKKYSLMTFLDPGGIEGNNDLMEAIKIGGYLIKPNEHEAKIITGIEIIDLDSAAKAAERMFGFGYEYVVITHGAKGAYAFGNGLEKHFTVPAINISNGNSVGCGDQALAGIIYGISSGLDIEKSIEMGVKAGTLQHTKNGIVPVTLDEIESC